MHEIDTAKHVREEARWRILRALDAGRPHPVAETVIFAAIADVQLPLSPHDVRRELDYLAAREMIHIVDRDAPTWLAGLTRVGIDFVEYTIAAEPGIARPKKWY